MPPPVACGTPILEGYAEALTWNPGSDEYHAIRGASCVMSRKASKYNSTGASYGSFDGETMGMEGSLVAFDGFWVKA